MRRTIRSRKHSSDGTDHLIVISAVRPSVRGDMPPTICISSTGRHGNFSWFTAAEARRIRDALTKAIDHVEGGG